MPNYSLLKHFAQNKHKKLWQCHFLYYVHAIKYSEHLLISLSTIAYCNQIDQMYSKLYRTKILNGLTFIIVYVMFSGVY